MSTPKVYSVEGCAYCDRLTIGKQYQGTLSESRIDKRTQPWHDETSGIRLTRTVTFHCETGEEFIGGEVTHGNAIHEKIKDVDNLIAFTTVGRNMKRYALTK